jgi:hypothetical protein
MNLINLTSIQLNRAAKIKDEIEALTKQLNALLGGSASVTAIKAVEGGMSAAGRARIAAAQRARWAKVKAKTARGPVAAAKPAMKKRKISAAGLAAIKAAQKARWAKVKGEQI